MAHLPLPYVGQYDPSDTSGDHGQTVCKQESVVPTWTSKNAANSDNLHILDESVGEGTVLRKGCEWPKDSMQHGLSSIGQCQTGEEEPFPLDAYYEFLGEEGASFVSPPTSPLRELLRECAISPPDAAAKAPSPISLRLPGTWPPWLLTPRSDKPAMEYTKQCVHEMVARVI